MADAVAPFVYGLYLHPRLLQFVRFFPQGFQGRRPPQGDAKAALPGVPGELGQLPVQNDPAAIQDQHPVADALRLRQDMRGQDNAAALGDVADQAADLVDLQGIQTGCRFVQDNHRRFVHNRLGDPDSLPVSSGKLAEQLSPVVFQTAGVAGPFRGGARLPPGQAAQTSPIPEVFVHGQVFVEGRLLRQEAEAAAGPQGLFKQVVAGDADGAFVHGQYAGNHFHEGSLAGAVGPQQPQHLPPLQVETHALNGGQRPIIAGHPFYIDQGTFLHDAYCLLPVWIRKRGPPRRPASPVSAGGAGRADGHSGEVRACSIIGSHLSRGWGSVRITSYFCLVPSCLIEGKP